MDTQLGFRTLPDAVADHIVTLIAVGKLRAGERIFEKDICGQLGVSRVPVREAIRMLQSQGIIRSEPNRGVFVSRFGSNEMRDLFEVRLCIERIAVQHLLERAQAEPHLLEELEDRIPAMEKAALLADRLAFCQAHLSFHEKIVALAESPVLTPLWESIARGVLVFLMQESDESYDFDCSVAEHRDLIELIRSGSADSIQKEWREHVRSTQQSRYSFDV